MTLQLLICTLDGGIENIADLLLEPREGVSYLVSWQHSDRATRELPAELKRADVEVIELEGRGLSRNRNNCINHASGDVCLLCDDDCRYDHNELNALVLTFATNLKLDIGTFKARGVNIEYPARSFNLNESASGYFAISFTIAFRRSSVQGRLAFNENFGLGAPELLCGEEELFIYDAKQLGLNCVYYPAFVVTHVGGETTTTKMVAHPGTLKARGAFLAIAYNDTKYRRAVLIAYRLHRDRGIGFFHALKNILKGIKMGKKAHAS